mmetsp:Transcript_66510/g.171177  ORF Transcript_66510/g.171177 Transcript_66510/m.171177 type:complete len:466 (-) Transcript_66510:76-1473(-)
MGLFESLGESASALLVYDTVKVVQIRDRRLGAIYYILLTLTLAFVVGYEILYCNDHFERRDVQGTPQVTIQQPTVDTCNPLHEQCNSNFRSLRELPYCSAYDGNGSLVPPVNRHECVYLDKFSLAPNGATSAGVMVPTRVDLINQTRLCHPSAANNYTCLNEFRVASDTGVRYVADIERYTLLISHSYRRDHIHGNNNALMGYYSECVETQRGLVGSWVFSMNRAVFGRQECEGTYRSVPIGCLPGADCGFQSAEQAPPQQGAALLQRAGAARQQPGRRRKQPAGRLERDVPEGGRDRATPEVYAITDGDVFSIGKLLQLAGASLDSLGTDGEPMRSAGSVLDIRVQYNNLHAFTSTFGDTSIGYEYFVNLRPIHQFKDEIISYVSADGNERSIENRHGLFVAVQINGTFGFFSIMNLLLMLTTATAILAVATVLTDKIALYYLTNQEYYRSLKYQTAEGAEEDI